VTQSIVSGAAIALTLGLVASLLSPHNVQAQIIPDTTLSAERSTVDAATTDGTSTYTIDGGAFRGSNLFHSFEQFSVPGGDTAVFANPDFVTHIISRVTGGNLSALEGVIQAHGNANLWLINPAGIVIGPNARLDIGGSFLATTGEGLQFDNGFIYDVATPAVPPLLTISAPIGLHLGNSPGPIQLVGPGGRDLPAWSVPEGQTLALIGGEVALTGAQLAAPGGRIELGAVQEAQVLSLTPDSQGVDVGFDSVRRFGPIHLTEQSILNTSGSGGGPIELTGQAITLSGQSALIADTLGDRDGREIRLEGDRVSLLEGSYIGAATLGRGASSRIEITANDIDLVGTAAANYKLVEFSIFLGTRQISDRQIGGIASTTVASGRTGDIALKAQRVRLDTGVIVSTESFGTGNSGDIAITATESLQVRSSGIQAGSRVLGMPLLTPDGVATGFSTSGIPAGSGGNIAVNTARLAVEAGSVIASGTLSDQASGHVVIKASESVTLGGSFAPFLFPTSITTISIGGQGAAGDLTVETGRLSLQDGSLIFADSGARAIVGSIPGGPAGDVAIAATESIDIAGGQPVAAVLVTSNIRARTFSEAPAGTIHITTPRLTLREGGLISSATLNDGAGGAIQIEADTILATGNGNGNVDTFSGIVANSGVETRVAFVTGAVESVPASGPGGSIAIAADTLTVQDTAQISVGSFGSGAAGNLNITANAVRLNNVGRLTATTTSDGGGNITLTANTLALENSRITASSDRGDGGNLLFNLRDGLLLRNGSLISTAAGTVGTGGNGGDIILNLPDGFIVAVPRENSDIRANAFEGNGGNVKVTARNLLGITFRPDVLDTPLSDITASSQLGNSGTVTIAELGSDVTPDAIDLPTELASAQLVQGCRAQGTSASRFVITGHGGLPTNPTAPLSADMIWQDLEPISPLTDRPLDSSAIAPLSEIRPPEPPVVEAQGWRRTADGTVVLLAQSPSATPDPVVPTSDCERVD
jgi:filamentous hemagglutinin family protein